MFFCLFIGDKGVNFFQDDQIASQIEKCLFWVAKKKNLGIEPSICIEKSKNGIATPVLKLFKPVELGKTSNFPIPSISCIKDLLWKLRLEWQYKNPSNFKGKWLLGLPNAPEVYPKSPVPIYIPFDIACTANGCSELCFADLKREEIIRCPKQNRCIVSALENLKKDRKHTNQTSVKKDKSVSTNETFLKTKIKSQEIPAEEVVKCKYEGSEQSIEEVRLFKKSNPNDKLSFVTLPRLSIFPVENGISHTPKIKAKRFYKKKNKSLKKL